MFLVNPGLYHNSAWEVISVADTDGSMKVKIIIIHKIKVGANSQ